MTSDNWFLTNAKNAREDGYDLVCAQCGMGMDDSDFEDESMHEFNCPNRGRDRTAEMGEFLAERLGPEKAAAVMSGAAKAAEAAEQGGEPDAN